jgi:prolyl-tRNA synthetase
MSNDQQKKLTAITPTRSENYPEWYQQVIKAADLADNSPVRGCMVIKPWGFAIWEHIQRILDGMIKKTGHQNAYFPLFIPLSFLEQEAKHIDGFAKECAVITHHRLEVGPDGKLVPAGKLDEPLIVRPTSETIIGTMYSKWVQSYRDLPILINQWANVVRWEMRTRMFLRTTEFLWQEGHTCHATADEARYETEKMLSVYAEFARNVLAIPVICGEKTPDERFPGAENTYSIEAMMQDGKALQAGTSHFLGQNFSKAQAIKFLDDKGTEQFAWTTSWGVSTRLVGGLIMTHSDDDGLVLPPRVAPAQLVLLPIYKTPEERSVVLAKCEEIRAALCEKVFIEKDTINAIIDDRDLRGGEKTWQHIKKGVPIRVEIGPRDLAAGHVMVARRDQSPKQKNAMPFDQLIEQAPSILRDMQQNLFQRALDFRRSNTVNVQTREELEAMFAKDDELKSVSKFVKANCDPTQIPLDLLKKLKFSARCVPLDDEDQLGSGTCIFSGKKVDSTVIFARAY